MRTISFLAVLLLAACGGGGGPPAPIEVAFDLGIMRADAPTTRVVQVENPLDRDATVDLVETDGGPFQIEPGTLPAVAAFSGTAFLTVVFTPSAAGPAEGKITVRFVGAQGEGEQEAIVTLDATVETPSLSRTPGALAFGDVRIGEDATRTFSVRNTSAATPVTVTGLASLPADFRIAGGQFPRTLQASESMTIGIGYAPTSLGPRAFDVTVLHELPDVDLVTSVTADCTTWVPEIITEFNDVPVVGGETGWLEVFVPPHAISLSLEVRGPTDMSPGLLGLEGPGGRVYENESLTGAYLWTPGELGIFTAGIPNSDREELLLVPGGGTYRFRFFAFAGSASTFDVRAIVHNRPGGVSVDGVVNLNVFLAPALGITVESAPFASRLQGILSETNRIFGKQGLRIGKVSYFELNDPAFDDITDNEFADLLRQSSAAPDTRLNLFFVRTALGGGVLGVAARVPGPLLNGTGLSGVMVDYDYGSIATAGHVTAHELCHYLGLFHTVEQNGQHDMIDDTNECPSGGTNAVCPTEGGDYLMHWRVLTADPIVTDGQGLVIRGHPLVGPTSALASLPLLPFPTPVGELDPLPDNWCGTPGCHR